MIDHARFIWRDSSGTGRNVFCIFRRRFHLKNIPPSVPLQVFADGLYRIRVNGKVVNCGPIRFLPAHPQFDTLDIAPWLAEGDNVIVVEVNARGANCYQAVRSIGGFIAAGLVGDVDVSTPGEWEVLKSNAWDAEAEPFSFAQGPVEILDTRLLPEELREGGDQRGAQCEWTKPVLLEHQEHWGKFEPRPIPLPSMRQIRPEKIKHLSPMHNVGKRYGFRLINKEAQSGRYKTYTAFITHLYSPEVREIELGSFWGPYFLNGVQLPHEVCGIRGNRWNYKVTLSAGWNLLYGAIGVLGSRWPVLFELPKGMRPSALPQEGCKEAFYFRDIIEDVNGHTLLSANPPATIADIPNFPEGWNAVRDSASYSSPARDVAWDMPGKPIELDGPVSFPVRIPCEQGGILLLDMGREYLGHVRLEVEAPAGTVIDLAYDERFRPDGLLGLYQSNPFVNNADRFVLAGGIQCIETFHERGGRYLQIAVRTTASAVTIGSVSVRQKTLMLPETGSFECGDALFNWTWQKCVATEQESLTDGWIDPWRERGLYLGDTVVEAPVTRKFTNDWSTERWAIELWSRAQSEDGQLPDVVPSAKTSPLCDYTLLWIPLLRDYWASTGDAEFVRKLWPTIPRIFASSVWKPVLDGLWEAHSGCPIFVDWGVANGERTGINGVLNAFRIHALERAAELGDLIGEETAATGYRLEAKRLREAFSLHLWDAQRGRYAGYRSEGELADSPSLHVNALAAAYRIGTPAQVTGALNYLRERLKENHKSPEGCLELYFLYYALTALYEHGDAGTAEEVIRSHYGIMKDMGAWTLWECLARGKQATGSHCHGWAAAPAIFFSERCLGVRMADRRSDGKLLIAPESESLDWARGRVPHPKGSVYVDWRVNGDTLEIAVKLPAGAECVVEPVGRLSRFKRSLRVN